MRTSTGPAADRRQVANDHGQGRDGSSAYQGGRGVSPWRLGGDSGPHVRSEPNVRRPLVAYATSFGRDCFAGASYARQAVPHDGGGSMIPPKPWGQRPAKKPAKTYFGVSEFIEKVHAFPLVLLWVDLIRINSLLKEAWKKVQPLIYFWYFVADSTSRPQKFSPSCTILLVERST